MKKTLFLTVVICALLALGACSDDSGGGLSIGSLNGTWRGVGRDITGALVYGELIVTLDGSGGLSGSEAITPSSFSGTYTQESGQIFGFELSNGATGGFIVDSSGTHAGFLEDGGAFGVLEKGAASIPTGIVEGDIVGSWSGIGVETDFVNFTVVNSNVTVSSSGSFSGSDTTGDNVTGNLSSPFSFGVYVFSFSSSVDGPGIGEAYMSPDKTFVATWGCTGGLNFPGDCGFTAWNKQ